MLSYEEILGQSLRIDRVISTASTYASQQGSSQSDTDKTSAMTEIGRGFQGAVFEQPGRSHALKKEHPGNSTLSTSLRHEYAMHQRVATAFDGLGVGCGCKIRVPRPLRFFERAELAGQDLAAFPEEHRSIENTVEMERILPMPKVVRTALVGHTQGPRANQILLDDIANKHCLLRPYLGRSPPKKAIYSLRNYPLDLAMMESLKMDVHSIADAMGAAFAIMHWGAGVDGDDVEFVLGTSLLSQTPSFMQERQVELFLLDFGQCGAVDLRDAQRAAVHQAFKGAMVTGDNQWFIPNLVQRPDVYRSFKEGYARAGRHVLEQRSMDHFDVGEFLAEYEEYAEDLL